jgi:hypothetical protein
MAIAPYSPSPTSGTLLGGVDFTDPSAVSAQAGSAATGLSTQGSALSSQGTLALGPVLQRLMRLLSGNPGDVGTATQPQVDQIQKAYNAARKNIANFGGRGGGTNATIAESQLNEASDIGTTRANAVNQASAQLADIGKSLLGTGAQEQETGLSGLVNLVQSALQSQTANRQMWSQIGLGVGKLALAAGLSVATEGAAAPLAASLIGGGVGSLVSGQSPQNADLIQSAYGAD